MTAWALGPRARLGLSLVALGAALAGTLPVYGASSRAIALICGSLILLLNWTPASRPINMLLSVATLVLASQLPAPWCVPVAVTLPVLLLAHSEDFSERQALSLTGCVASVLALILSFGFFADPIETLAHGLARLVQAPEVFGSAYTFQAAAVCFLAGSLAALAIDRRSLKRLLIAVPIFALFMLASARTASPVPSIAGLAALGWVLPWQATRRISRKPALAGLGLTLVSAGLLAAAFQLHHPLPRHVKVAILDIGAQEFLTYNVASGPWRSEPDAVASFGHFVKIMRDVGWEVQFVGPEKLATIDPREFQVLCVIDLSKQLLPMQTAGAKKFVAGGGGLLILGDHTDIFGLMTKTNDLIRFTAIRYNFDSAVPDPDYQAWHLGQRMATHPIFSSLGPRDIQIGIGASLTVGPAARTLVVGEHGFSDPGDRKNPVKENPLGNLTYEAGKSYGGLPMVAEQPYGDGLVQVWGDTSSFQDSALAFARPMVLNDVAYLAGGRSLVPPSVLVFMCGALLLLAGVLLMVGWPTLAAAVSIGVCGVLGGLAANQVPVPEPPKTYVVLDTSCWPSLGGADFKDYPYGLSDICLRAGMPLYLMDVGLLEGANPPKWIVVQAPHRAYNDRELQRLLAYVKAGGHLLVAAGYPQNRAVTPLLACFGLRLAEEPFGRAAGAEVVVKRILPSGLEDSKPLFKDCYSILGRAEKIVTWSNDPILVRQSYGQGEVWVFGDSRILLDDGLGEGNQKNLATCALVFGIISRGS